MSLVCRFSQGATRLAWALFALSLIGAGSIVWRALDLSEPPPEQHAGRVLGLPAFPDTTGAGWSAFRRVSPTASAATSSLDESLRLAGTFSVYGSEGGRRRAILDDLRTGQQRIVDEGDRIGPLVVRRILTDRVRILTANGVLQELRLIHTAGVGTRGSPGPTQMTSGARFGIRRVGERRWAFDREAVLDYYQELRDDPRRLVQVFDSMVPVYDANRAITGYRLTIFGEEALFGAAGLHEGDIVRRANSIDMTSRKRAEYLINEFLQNRANIFIFDIERAG